MADDNNCSDHKRETGTPEPEPKRAKTGAEAGKVWILRSALQGADIGVPWSSSLRELLISQAPAALGVPCEPSPNHQTVVAKTISGILIAEEKHVEQRVAGAQARLQQVKAERHESRTASDRAEEAVQKREVGLTNSKLKTLADNCVGLSDAEANFMQRIQTMLVKERDFCKAAMQKHLESIKSGTVQDKAHHVSVLVRAAKKLGMDPDPVEALRCAMEMKPADRSDAQRTALEGLEQTLSSHLRKVEELRTFNKTICFQPRSKPNDMSMDDAVSVVEHHKKRENTRSRVNCLEAKRDNFEPLKTGKQGASWLVGEQAHHLGFIGRLIKRIEPDNVCLHLALPVALKKGPSERGDFDSLIVQEVEKVLDKFISAKDQELGDLVVAEATWQQFVDSVSNVKHVMNLEAEMKKSLRQALGKEKDKCLQAQTDRLPSLKAGSCEQSKEQQKNLQVLLKILKNLDSSYGNPHVCEVALLEALPIALQRLPDDRADFDKTVIEQVESTLQKRVEFIEEQVNILNDGNLEELASAVDEAKLALEQAGERQLASAKAVLDAEDEKKRAKIALEEAKKALLHCEALVAEAEETLTNDKDALEMVREAIATLPSNDID